MLKKLTDINNNKFKQIKSKCSKAIRFDEIHTNEKQLKLDRMMSCG